MRRFLPLLLAFLALPVLAEAPSTERLYLSGTGSGEQAVPWLFRCEAGPRCGGWTTLPVPSQWEQHGLGRYDYGHDEDKHLDEGVYRRRLQVPGHWTGRSVELIFEGVMTDTEVLLDGEPLGPVHQGGFYRFRFDLTDRITPGTPHLLEVRVRDVSADRSVEKAEREADYWVFGGIFRPVFLESRPAEAVLAWDLDARHDGALRLQVETQVGEAAQLVARVLDEAGNEVGDSLEVAVPASGGTVELAGNFPGVEPWSAEIPRLYWLRLELQRDGQVLHAEDQRMGFRTIELRTGEGLFVNGRRTLLKGINRHAFHPETGRALTPEIDWADVERIKGLNLNAVRSSHYPPDKSFLEACDELGLYVINELAGWHDAYNTKVGEKLVESMVRRDRNHPSILFWANGNEGGWNTDLDDDFHVHDLEKRPVFHPHEVFGGIDALHYLTWGELEARLDPASWLNRWRALFGPLPLWMPTELIHGLYDGGSGANLLDYWGHLRQSPRFMGFFLWSLLDESIARWDQDGALDSAGNYAPDGVLNAYREDGGSVPAIREIFSPVQVTAFGQNSSGQWEAVVENHFDHLDLDATKWRWRLLELPMPGASSPPAVLVESEEPGPSLAPGKTGSVSLPLTVLADSVLPSAELQVRDAAGREILRRVWPLGDVRSSMLETARSGKGAVNLEKVDDHWLLSAAGMEVEVDATTGTLLRLGARYLAGPQALGAKAPRGLKVEARRSKSGAEVSARTADGKGWTWTLHSSGWLRLEFHYELKSRSPYHGLGFTLDLEQPNDLAWSFLGKGPVRQWKNRRSGTLDLWRRTASEEEVTGYYDVLWVTLELPDTYLLLVPESEGLPLGFLTPEFPEDSMEATAEVPEADLSILPGLPAMGTKFHTYKDLGPSAQPHEPGVVQGAVWFRLLESQPNSQEQ